MRAWVVRAPDVTTFRIFERDGFVGLRGGPPDLAVTDDLSGLDAAGIAAAVRAAGLATNHAEMLTAFVRDAAEGDPVVTPEPGRKPGRDVLLGRVTGDYEHRGVPEDGTGFAHVRAVTWVERLPRAIFPAEFWQGRVAALTEAPLDAVRELLDL
jgi:predicted Mrr-cat superfamily restriction endonuclease